MTNVDDAGRVFYPLQATSCFRIGRRSSFLFSFVLKKALKFFDEMRRFGLLRRLSGVHRRYSLSRTKIVCTLGPSSESAEMVAALVSEGARFPKRMF